MPRYRQWQKEPVRVLVVEDETEFMFPRIFATCRNCVFWHQKEKRRARYYGYCDVLQKTTAGVSSCDQIAMLDDVAMSVIHRMERNLSDWPVLEWGFEPWDDETA